MGHQIHALGRVVKFDSCFPIFVLLAIGRGTSIAADGAGFDRGESEAG